MIIAGMYSFNDGKKIVQVFYADLFDEIKNIIVKVDANRCKTKKSKEKTMRGRTLYSPKALNKAFKKEFKKVGWTNHKVQCEYSTEYYVDDYNPQPLTKGAFRDMDFVKRNLGVEVQFGKYAFMVYNVCAKMTIFNKLGVIKAGVEIVPIKAFTDEMSTGVSYLNSLFGI